MNKAYNKPTKKITIIRIDKLLINLLFNKRILFGKNFFNMKIFYIKTLKLKHTSESFQ